MDECKHELVVEECSLCNGKHPKLPPVLGPWFRAMYDGSCHLCGAGRIYAGDEVCYVDDTLACEPCAVAAYHRRPKPNLIPTERES